MKVLYFARAREMAGTKSEEIEVPDDSTVADVLGHLGPRFGAEFAALVRRSTVMVDDSVVNRDRFAVHPAGSEMAILPPVSGGDGPDGGPGGSGGPEPGGDPESGGVPSSTESVTPDDPQHVHHGEGSGSGSQRSLRVALLTVSDRASVGQYEDLTGPELRALVTRRLDAVVNDYEVVEDSFDAIAQTLRSWCDRRDVDLVITNGGTGLSTRDVTPEATRSVLDAEAPGLGELMRRVGTAKTPLAALSRQTAGRRGSTIVVNVPGSVKGAVESLDAIIDVLPHACAIASQDTK